VCVHISVSIVTELRVGRPGFYSRYGRDFFFFPPHPDRLWGPLTLLSNGYGEGFFPRR